MVYSENERKGIIQGIHFRNARKQMLLKPLLPALLFRTNWRKANKQSFWLQREKTIPLLYRLFKYHHCKEDFSQRQNPKYVNPNLNYKIIPVSLASEIIKILIWEKIITNIYNSAFHITKLVFFKLCQCPFSAITRYCLNASKQLMGKLHLIILLLCTTGKNYYAGELYIIALPFIKWWCMYQNWFPVEQFYVWILYQSSTSIGTLGLVVKEIWVQIMTCKCFPGSSVVKNPLANAGAIGDMALIPGLGRSLGGRNDNPLQCSCQDNPMDRGAWWTIVHEVAKESDMTECAHIHMMYNFLVVCGSVNLISLPHMLVMNVG